MIASLLAALTATAPLTIAVEPPGAVAIVPGDGQTIAALGHDWTFGPVQDWFTGFDVFEDGQPTSNHGVRLVWDGASLTLTWHHPYPFDPATGLSWTPPLYSARLSP